MRGHAENLFHAHFSAGRVREAGGPSRRLKNGERLYENSEAKTAPAPSVVLAVAGAIDLEIVSDAECFRRGEK